MDLREGADLFPGNAAIANISSKEQVGTALNLLGLQSGQRTLVLVGGAGGMSAEEIDRIQTFFERTLVPFVDRNQIAVIDGGTNAGIMEAIGSVRSRLEAGFPLIGVLVEALARRTPGILQKDHTHFLLVPGSDWGDEVSWIGALAGEIAGNAPSLTLLVNGGEIAWQDAALSVEAKRPLMVVDGTGRTADIISRTYAGQSQDARAVELLKSQMVLIANPFQQPGQFMQRIESIYKPSWNNKKRGEKHG
jgi:hypothetical protein